MKEKPLSLIIKEIEDSIVKQINDSKLSVFIWKTIFEKIYNQLVSVEQQEIELYNKSLNEKKEEKNEKTNA